MYSRSQASQLKQAFWMAFGRYLAPYNNSEGRRINWINYHTGFKYVYFRMEADQEQASLSIELMHPDEFLRELFFDKLKSFRAMLAGALGEEWNWEQECFDETGKKFARIFIALKGVNVYNQNEWPQVISFLKPRIIALDRFWNEVKDAFEELR